MADDGRTVTPEPQRLGPREVATEMDRRLRASRVEVDQDMKASPADRTRRRTGGDLDPQGPPLEKGRAIGDDPTRLLPTAEGGRGGRLSASEMEKRFARHAKFLESLGVEERRAVEEYFRRLRDIR
jgi:hypothetical protein